jgi:hypothetical protein
VSARQSRPKLVDQRAWAVLALAQADASGGTDPPCSVLFIEVEPDRQVDDVLIGAVTDLLRPSDVVARTDRTTIGVLVPGFDVGNAGQLARRIQTVLSPLADVTVRYGGARGTPVVLRPTAGAVSQRQTYVTCGSCGRRGAYLSRGRALLRCRYCRSQRTLSDAEAARAVERLAELARDLPKTGTVRPLHHRFVRCGGCGRSGAYVSLERCVVRCRYCRSQQILSPGQVRHAAEHLDEIARGLRIVPEAERT